MPKMRNATVLFVGMVLLAPLLAPSPATAAFESLFAPKARLWQRWSVHDAGSRATIDHQAWDRILKRTIKPGPEGLNRIAYAAFSPEQKKGLASYVRALSAIKISRYARSEQFAYWVNLYNALTVRVVLERYPVKSIRDIDISPGLFADGPWGKKLVSVEGHKLSLDDIEHRVLRPIWRDARIHYVVNCAAYSCPNLRPSALTSANTEDVLEAAARDYVNSPRGVRFERGRMVVSSLYVWYASDFGGSDAKIIGHLMRYARGPLKAKLAKISSLDKHAYDWKLND